MTSSTYRHGLREAFGFRVGQGVTMLCETSGDDHEGNYRVVPPGASGTIDSIERYGSQGVTFTVVIKCGVYDKAGDEFTIVNSFDETDGPISKYLA